MWSSTCRMCLVYFWLTNSGKRKIRTFNGRASFFYFTSDVHRHLLVCKKGITGISDDKKADFISSCPAMLSLCSAGRSTWSLRKMWRWKESRRTASLHHALFWPAKRRTPPTRVSASPQRSAWEPASLKSVPVGKVNVSLCSIFSHPRFALSHASPFTFRCSAPTILFSPVLLVAVHPTQRPWAWPGPS